MVHRLLFRPTLINLTHTPITKVRIYSSYDEEPEDIYLPLPANLYRDFYDLELTEFSQDLQFYTTALKPHSQIIELGCGSGRLTRKLADSGHQMLGIDLSFEMLQAARTATKSNVQFIQGDMRQIPINIPFDAVIIPYNTLNLLRTTEDIIRCLAGCLKVLKGNGLLLLQIHIPTEVKPESSTTSTFQFQMFDRPQGGKIIKEVLKTTDYRKQLIEMTERYKVRPMTEGQENINYSHTMVLNGWNRQRWFSCIEECGFRIDAHFSDYTMKQKHAATDLLLIQASKNS